MLTEALSSTIQNDYPAGMTSEIRGKGGSVIDPQTRARIVAWLKYEYEHRGFESIRAYAARLGTSHTYITRALAGEQQPGLELVLRMHKKLHVSIDRMVDEDPPTARR